MSEWKETTLSEISIINPTENLVKGIKAKKVNMDVLIPFTKKIPSYSIEEYKGGMKFRNGDTIIARITPCLENGKTAYVDFLDDDEIGFGSTEFVVLRKKDGKSDSHFLYYFALSPDFRDVAILSMTGSSGRQRVQLDVIKNHPFLLPPLPEQRAIASVLSSLDDKIDLLHRENKTLEAMAETLFRQWFVEEAKDEWEEVPLSEVTKIAIGRTPPRKESHWFSTDPKDVKWVSIKDLGQSEVFVFDTSEYLKQEAVENFNIPIIPADTVLLSFKMTVGRVGITTEPMVSNEAIAHFKFDDNTPFSKEYLYIFLKTFKYESLGSTSSIVTAINSSMIKDIEIIIPDDITMNVFRTYTEPLFSKIKANIYQIRTLEKLRNTLLPKLMSGEVRIQY